ncbi:pseudouridine synthase [Streptomyces sp. Ac-502]|uniref:pseudouridine synthase n=1 Tax=Streptomyces sp. Ac-502 TaxID=3342801 RepID=UPI0038625D0D
MRSSGRNNRDTGRGNNYRGAGNKKDEKQQRAGRPRPEERRYDVGEGGPGRGDGGSRGDGGGRGGSGGRGGQGGGQGGRGGSGGSGGRGGAPDRGDERRGRGAAARGGAKGGPRTSPKSGGKPGGKGPQQRGRGQAPVRPREYDAQVEERNRARHSKPQIKTPKTFGDQEGERLQKVLARAGMGSRRACEELIDQARVEVNGQIVMEQGVRVDPDKDEVKVDGLTVATQSYLFFALNKPAGVVSTMEDPDGRQCLGDYVTNRETRLFHVGRLDTETEGIILLTNHGELAHRLTHPRYGVTKTYLAAIQGPLPRDLGKQLKEGIQLEDGYARADHFRVVENTGKNYLVEVTLHEGRKHIVRRMLAEAGFPVDKLVRTAFGPIALGDQKSGWLRRMTNTEVGMLMREVEL